MATATKLSKLHHQVLEKIFEDGLTLDDLYFGMDDIKLTKKDKANLLSLGEHEFYLGELIRGGYVMEVDPVFEITEKGEKYLLGE